MQIQNFWLPNSTPSKIYFCRFSRKPFTSFGMKTRLYKFWVKTLLPYRQLKLSKKLYTFCQIITRSHFANVALPPLYAASATGLDRGDSAQSQRVMQTASGTVLMKLSLQKGKFAQIFTRRVSGEKRLK